MTQLRSSFAYAFAFALGLALALLAVACTGPVSGDPDGGSTQASADAAGDPSADAAEPAVDGAAQSGPGAHKVIVWQHNISWYSSAFEAEKAIHHAWHDFPEPPDILMFQECGKYCICGADGQFDKSTGTCSSIAGPGIARALKTIGKATLDRYRFSYNGLRTIAYRSDRFAQIGEDLTWGATPNGAGDNYAACSTVSVGEQLSVALNDKGASPPRQILVSTGHWFVSRDCACKQVSLLESHWKNAVALRRDDGTDAAAYVDLHVFGGDWNAQPSTSLPVAYRSGGACDGANLGGEHHVDTAGDVFTFCQGAGGVSHPTTCTNKQKVDYLWARDYNGSGITWKGSPDTSANYSNDHRAVRTVFTY